MRDVLILDDDEDLREALADLVRFTSGRSCVAVGSVAELRLQRERALDCELAILDVNLGAGRPSGLDAYAWLRAQQFRGRIVFLTGHGQNHPAVQKAATLDGAQVLLKPVGLDDLNALFLKRRVAA